MSNAEGLPRNDMDRFEIDSKGVEMVDLQVTTLNGQNTVLDESKLAGFQAALRGPLIQPGDESYDEQRQVWNANVDKRPALIARCAGVADVITCVNLARENDLLVSVRGAAGLCRCRSDSNSQGAGSP